MQPAGESYKLVCSVDRPLSCRSFKILGNEKLLSWEGVELWDGGGGGGGDGETYLCAQPQSIKKEYIPMLINLPLLLDIQRRRGRHDALHMATCWSHRNSIAEPKTGDKCPASGKTNRTYYRGPL